jgi:ankyrin repeat protein
MLKNNRFIVALLSTSLSTGAFASNHLVEQNDLDSQLSPRTARAKATYLQWAFPNFYQFMPIDERLSLLERSMGSTLDSLQVPHFTEGESKPQFSDFFNKIMGMVELKDPRANVYIAGGMVRSLLGYNYHKLYKAFEKSIIQSKEKGHATPPVSDTIRKTFDRLLNQPKEQGLSATPLKSRNYLKALGINSDFDILVDFSEDTPESLRQEILRDVHDFINSAEKSFGLNKNSSKVKRAIVPSADVQEYQKQLGTTGDRSAVLQGGLTLDWLAYDLKQRKIRMPEGHPKIVEDFFEGMLSYLPPQEGFKARDKQVIRALRPLPEILFPQYKHDSEALLKTDLEQIGNTGSLSTEAEEQKDKLHRNSRYGSAFNIFAKPKTALTQQVKSTSDKIQKSSATLALAAEFLASHSLELRDRDAANLRQNGILMDNEAFARDFTNDGIVNHGTDDVVNLLNMLRNGFLISNTHQGRAAQGRGFYTAKDVSTASTYAKDTGIVVPIHVHKHKNLRVLNLNSEKAKKFTERVSKEYPDQDLHEVLEQKYDIDIIIAGDILIQNAAALKMPKDVKFLIQAQIDAMAQDINKSVNDKLTYSEFKRKIEKWLNHVHPDKGFKKIFVCLGGTPSDQGLHKIAAYIEREISLNNVEAADLALQEPGILVNLEPARKVIEDHILRELGRHMDVSVIQRWYELNETYNLVCGFLGFVGKFRIHDFLTCLDGSDAARAGTFYNPLLQSASKGYKEVVLFLLEAGAPISTTEGATGASLLHLAAAIGNLELVTSLLERKLSINLADKQNELPMDSAARNGHIEIMEFLVAQGADLKAINVNGRSVLTSAVRGGSLKAIDFLLGLGLDMRIKDAEGNTLLTHAAMNGHVDVLKFLMGQGLALDEPNAAGKTPLLAAISMDRDLSSVVEYLLQNGANPNTISLEGSTPLSEAVKGNRTGVTEMLLKNGADHTVTNGDGESLLVLAARHAGTDIIERLIDKGLSLDVLDKDGKSLLQLADDRKDPQTIYTLLVKGVKANVPPEFIRSFLTLAIEQQHHDLLKLLMEKSDDVTVKLENGDTLVHCAVRNSDLESLQLLVAKGANFNERNLEGNSPLDLALRGYNDDVTRFLIVNGNDIEAKDHYGRSLMRWAIDHKDLKTFKALIEKGANWKAPSEDGDSWLSVAISNGCKEIANYLIDIGADINAKGQFGSTPLFKAVEDGETEMALLLLERGASFKEDPDGFQNTPNKVAEKGNAIVLQKMIDLGLDVHAEDSYEGTLLCIAAQHGQLEVFRLLLNKSANITYQNFLGKNAIGLAAAGGHIHIVDECLSSGLTIDTVNKKGETALFRAAECRKTAMVQYLLDKGASVHMRNKDSETPLHKAVINKHNDILLMLLDKGADVNVADAEGKTPLHIAAKKGNNEAAQALLSRGAKVNAEDSKKRTPIFYALEQAEDSMVGFLIDVGADVNHKDEYGKTPLFIAASWGSLEAIKMLCKAGANIHEKDIFGKKAILEAISSHKVDKIRFLLEKGADINGRDNDGETGLFAVVAYRTIDELRDLIALGADPAIKDNTGRSILFKAINNKDKAILTYLVKEAGLNISEADKKGNTVMSLATAAGEAETIKLLQELGAK